MADVRTPRGTSFGRAALIAVVSAALSVLVVHLLFDALGADFRVQPPGQSLNTVAPLQAAAIAAVVTALGCGVAWLLLRRARWPDRAFLVVVAVVLAVFAINPFLAADQGLTVIALQAEHFAAAIPAVLALLPVLRGARR